MDYQKRQRSTAIYPQKIVIVYEPYTVEVVNNIFYPVLKLQGEIGELFEAIGKHSHNNSNIENINKELGDCAWYISDIAYHLGVDYRDLPTQFVGDVKESVSSLLDFSSRAMAEAAGKYMRKYDAKYLPRIKQELLTMNKCIWWLAKYYGQLDFLERNITKLSDRAERGVLHGSGDNR